MNTSHKDRAMDDLSLPTVTNRLGELSVNQPTQVNNDQAIPTPSIVLYNNALREECGGYGHWGDSCDFVEHTKLSGRPRTSFSPGSFSPNDDLRFNLCLPWLALRFPTALLSTPANYEYPVTYSDAISLVLEFTTHLSDYGGFSGLQYLTLHNVWTRLHGALTAEAQTHTSDEMTDQVNNVNYICRAFADVAVLEPLSLGELITNVIESLRQFETTALLMPIVGQMIQESPASFPIVDSVREVSYREIWEYINEGRIESVLETRPIPVHFERLVTAISNHRSAYMQRRAAIEQKFRDSVSNCQPIRENPVLLTVFAAPTAFAMPMDIAQVDSLRWDDFRWPDKYDVLSEWYDVMDRATPQGMGRAAMEVTGLLQFMHL